MCVSGNFLRIFYSSLFVLYCFVFFTTLVLWRGRRSNYYFSGSSSLLFQIFKFPKPPCYNIWHIIFINTTLNLILPRSTILSTLALALTLRLLQ